MPNDAPYQLSCRMESAVVVKSLRSNDVGRFRQPRGCWASNPTPIKLFCFEKQNKRKLCPVMCIAVRSSHRSLGQYLNIESQMNQPVWKSVKIWLTPYIYQHSWWKNTSKLLNNPCGSPKSFALFSLSLKYILFLIVRVDHGSLIIVILIVTYFTSFRFPN